MKVLKFFEMAGKRKLSSNIIVTIDDKIFSNKTAADTFRESIAYIAKKVGFDKFKSEINSILNRTSLPKSNRNSIISDSVEKFPSYVRKGSIKLIEGSDIYLSTHCNTQEKINILKSLMSFYSIEGHIEIFNHESDD